MPISLKNFLDTALKVINFLKSCPLSTYRFNILCEKVRRAHKMLLLHSEIQLSGEKTVV